MWTVLLLIFHCIFFSASLFDFPGLTLQDPWRFLYFSGRPCEGRDGRIGVCMEPKICAWKGGVEVGSCQQGRRICCSASRSCGQTVSVNESYFINPEYPESLSSARACSVRLASVSDLCQVRLDFEDFILRGPDSSTGRCEHDALRVTGGDRNDLVPSFCGSNSGQHAYIEVYSSSGPLTLTVVTSEHAGIDRKWKIKITTIRCESPWKAPNLCLQYYLGSSGSLTSFNYGLGEDGRSGYPAGLNYAICIRKEEGMCSLAMIARSKFQLGPAQERCPDEYLAVDGVRYCGEDAFSQMVLTSEGGPMIVFFKSPRTPSGNWMGFDLRYRQIPCITNK
ncbi:uncharacterized protein [Centruroides vittatus]|uniref:uncharacterized protein n=1 Tax=Centruroides vittatus TaxID=120091 RepID=UPI00350FA35C